MKKLLAFIISLLLIFETIPFDLASAKTNSVAESLPTNMFSGYKSPAAKTVNSTTNLVVGGSYNAGAAVSLNTVWGKADGSGNNGDPYSPINTGYYQLDFDVTISEDINTDAKIFPQFHSNASILGMKDLVGVRYEIASPGNCVTAHNFISANSGTVKPSAEQSATLKAGTYRYTYVFNSPKEQNINYIVILINGITSGTVKVENAALFSLENTEFQNFDNQPNKLVRFMVEDQGNIFQRIYGYRTVGSTDITTRYSLSSKIDEKYYDIYFKSGNTYTLNFDFRFPKGELSLKDIKYAPMVDFYETRTLDYTDEYSEIKTLANSNDTDTKTYVAQTYNNNQISYQDNKNAYSYFYAAAEQSTVCRRINKNNIVNFAYYDSDENNLYSISTNISAIGREAKNDADLKENNNWLSGAYSINTPKGQTVSEAYIAGISKTASSANATRYVLTDTSDEKSWSFQNNYNSYFASSEDNAYVALGIGYLYSGCVYDFDNLEINGNFDLELPISYQDINGNEQTNNTPASNYASLIKNNDNTHTAKINYNSFNGAYIFKGWYEEEKFISDNAEFTFSSDEISTTLLTAKIISLNVIDGDPGFENYNTNDTVRVEPANSNIAPYNDRWGIYNNHSNQHGAAGYENGDWPFNIKAFTGTVTDQYKEYIIDTETNEKVLSGYIPYNVTPYNGNTMIGVAVKSRSIVRKIQNLAPNTEYTLSFYVNNPSNLDYLKTATIANTYDLPSSTTTSTTAKIYTSYIENGSETITDEAKVRNWKKITLNFTTDNAKELYLHLSFTNKDTSINYSRVYIDNLICTPNIIKFEGNSIRAKSAKLPQALRYKFSMDNSYFENTINEIGILALDSSYLGEEELVINGEYTANGETKLPACGIINESNVQTSELKSSFTAALYNIGRTDGKIDYEKFATDFAVRPYLKLQISEGNEITLYGNTISASVFDVIQSIYTEFSSADDIETANAILTIKEAQEAYKRFEDKSIFFKFRDDVAASDYSFVYVGDTQVTTELFPEYLDYTYDWIVNNKESKNIKYAITLGDLTQNSTNEEYAAIENGLKNVENAGIYQSILRGNHDSVASFDNNITQKEYGSYLSGTYDNTLKNTYHIFTVGNEKYMMLTLDYYPNSAVVDWAASLVENNLDCRVIINTHGLLNYDMSLLTDSNVIYMHENLITKYKNIIMVVCGHHDADGPKYKYITGQNGNKIVEMMINPQGMEKQTNQPYGFVAVLHFSNSGKTVEIEYFSTVRNAYYKSEFQLVFELE